MAFSSKTFIFNGTPSDYYGLYLYSFDSAGTSDCESGGDSEILEDRSARRIAPIHYGCENKKPLEFEMTFGSFDYLDKYDVDLIAAWLTEQTGYRTLDLVQADMENIRYKCLITDLKNTYVNGMPVAFKCTVSCDSSYAYSYPACKFITVDASALFTVVNASNIGRYIYPLLEITPARGASSISIVNKSDGNREFKFDKLPQESGLKITVDNDKQMISASSNMNLYDCFNGHFLRLRNGVNELTVTGSCGIQMTYEALRKVGA